MAILSIPQAFLWRRLQSLMGLALVLFLCEHLFTNSQAAFLLGEEGWGFVRIVNTLHNLPCLRVIESVLIGVPLLLHAIWGIRYAWTSKFNSGKSDGSAPSISTFSNRAYTWQRVSAWFLIFALIVHVFTLRFLNYPGEIRWKSSTYYAVKISSDEKLLRLTDHLGVLLYDAHLESSGFLNQLDVTTLKTKEVFAVSKEFGAVCLLTVRDTFKNPFWLVFYTLFVASASFHAFNGFWTFLITWGWVLKASAQRAWTLVAFCLMALFLFLGLLAIWGSFLGVGV